MIFLFQPSVGLLLLLEEREKGEQAAECFISPLMTCCIYCFLIVRAINLSSLCASASSRSLSFTGVLWALVCLCCYFTPELGVTEVSQVFTAKSSTE